MEYFFSEERLFFASDPFAGFVDTTRNLGMKMQGSEREMERERKREKKEKREKDIERKSRGI